MASFNNFQQDDQVPPLVPLKRKKAETNLLPSPNSQSNQAAHGILANILKDSVKNTPKNQQNNKDSDKNVTQSKKQPNPQKMEQIDKRISGKISTVQKKDNQSNKIQNQRIKQNQKTKFLIAKHLHQMSLKNLSQQLYPVSNQAIQQLLEKITQQIAEFNKQAEKKQSTLAVNQNNLHLKKQLETIRRQIDHCCLIKQLYYEKMNYRNKIQTLEEEILNLKSQNQSLIVKVQKSKQAIQNYKNGLPGNSQKQLKEKLQLCEKQLNQERQTRKNLQKNIQNIINNFKRLYQQADIARQIVIKKLRQIQQRQRKFKKIKQAQQQEHSQQNSPVRRVVSLQLGQEKKPSANSHADFNNDFHPAASKRFGEQQTRKMQNRQKLNASNQQKQQKRTDSINNSMTLEQKIKKMRNNQLVFNKNIGN